jgi:hypothetical protein
VGVINQIDGPIITFRDGRRPTTISSDYGKAATCYQEPPPALDRMLHPLCSDSCTRFAAIAVIGALAVNDSRRHIAVRRFAPKLSFEMQVQR